MNTSEWKDEVEEYRGRNTRTSEAWIDEANKRGFVFFWTPASFKEVHV